MGIQLGLGFPYNCVQVLRGENWNILSVNHLK